jgi:hypothetical protein
MVELGLARADEKLPGLEVEAGSDLMERIG